MLGVNIFLGKFINMHIHVCLHILLHEHASCSSCKYSTHCNTHPQNLTKLLSLTPKPYKMAHLSTCTQQVIIMICPQSYHNNMEAMSCVGAHPPHTLQYDYHCQYTHFVIHV